MSSPTNVKALSQQLQRRMSFGPPDQSPIGRRLSEPLDPPKAKEKERKVEDEVKKLSPPPVLRGNETLEEIQMMTAFYERCRGLITVKITKNDSKQTKRQDYLSAVEERLKQLQVMEKSRGLMTEVDLLLKKDEVEGIIKRLNDTSEERKLMLRELKMCISRLVLGEPSADGYVTKVVDSIGEMLRTGGSTCIFEGNRVVQLIRKDADQLLAKVDHGDLADRFRTIWILFQKYSGDRTSLPDTKEWTYEECKAWAEDIATFDDALQLFRLDARTLLDKKVIAGRIVELVSLSRQKPLPDASTWSVEECLAWAEKRAIFNEKMKRFIRSCSASMYTGSLLKKDVLNHAKDPAYMETLNKLFAALPAGEQQIYRYFNDDGTYSIKLILPLAMKTSDKKETARFTIDYTIGFDKELQVTSLTSKASAPIYNL